MQPGHLVIQFLCAAIERGINQAIAWSTDADLSLLNQKVIQVNLQTWSQSICLVFTDESVSVLTVAESPDCVITTSVEGLKRLREKQSITDLIKQGDLDIQGDIKVAQQLAHVMEQLTVDWETALAGVIGDVPTFHVTQFAKKLLTKLHFIQQQSTADTIEYLLHEKKLLVTQAEFKQQTQQIQQLTQQLEQLNDKSEHLLALAVPGVKG
jgi:ubiquinone biosynthesis protein UbiJ